MASRRSAGAAARTSGTRLLCQHGMVYPCDECRAADPSIREEEVAREAATNVERRVAGARVTAQTLRARLDPGDWIGGFQCEALDSSYVGQRMLLVFGREAFSGYLLGMQAPDTKSFGPGWKFRLAIKTESADEAASWLHRVGDYDDSRT